MRHEILIVDDDEAVAESLAEILGSKGYDTRVVTDPTKAVALATARTTELALVDLRMPGIGGIELLQAIKSRSPDLPVFIISGYVTVDAAVTAMKYGATDIFPKPVKTAELLAEIRRVMSERPAPAAADEAVIETRDPRMLEAVSLIARAAPTDASVLLRGESGTGKELAARLLHRQSRRAARPFLALNCAAISDELLESEMFGHERGAFTDARERKRGLLEVADGGTIFLDEIGEMSQRIQAKMLRVLQDGRFTRVGGVETLRSDVRLVSATNRDLDAAIRAGQFREDLYYRIAVVDIHIPPLRDRPGDVLPLAELFLSQFSERYGKAGLSFSPRVLEVLRDHVWPGNVRELKNFVERAVIFAEGGGIEMEHVSPQYRTVRSQGGADFHDRLVASAQDAIAEALSLAGGSKTKAAQLLNIDRKTLYNHLKKARPE